MTSAPEMPQQSDLIFQSMPAVRIAIDSSSDGHRAAFACLVMPPAEKPRLIYGQAWHVPMDKVEAWGIRRAVRRVDERYPERRRLLVFTDSHQMAIRTRGVRVQYRWISRKTWLIAELHRIANRLRRAMPEDEATWSRAREGMLKERE